MSALGLPASSSASKRNAGQGGIPKKSKGEEQAPQNGALAEAREVREAADEGLVQQLAMLSLQNSRDIRVIAAAVREVCVFSNEEEAGKLVCEATKGCTRQYEEHIRNMDSADRAGFSPPYVFVWHVLVDEVRKIALTKDMGAHQQKLKDYLEFVEEEAKARMVQLNTQDLTGVKRLVITEHIQAAAIYKTWNPKKARFEAQATHPRAKETADTIIEVLKAHAKGEKKNGPAPKGDLERKIEAKVKGKKGGNGARSSAK
eukprot:TRINITY_DN22854_c0_g1_i2.p2 TRINITY_DN22854_c0_g1~~TRINITY_DN22854_c0_g1_i2.p2  ORF type:complete len:259 (+),score=93.43 TRINITY_DN22854_c0_g1_i2:81-857(+)